MTEIETRLNELRATQRTLEAAETAAENLRETKWELVWELRGLGHDFRATPEGMDVVLASPPNMNWN